MKKAMISLGVVAVALMSGSAHANRKEAQAYCKTVSHTLTSGMTDLTPAELNQVGGSLYAACQQGYLDDEATATTKKEKFQASIDAQTDPVMKNAVTAGQWAYTQGHNVRVNEEKDSAPAQKTEIVPTNQTEWTCDVSRRLPAPTADDPKGPIVETVKGGAVIKDLGNGKRSVAFPWDQMDQKTTKPVERVWGGPADADNPDAPFMSQEGKSLVFNEISYHHSDYIFTNCK